MKLEPFTVGRDSPAHGNIEIAGVVSGAATDPLIVCVHGWPENWRSWTNQIERFSADGFRVAAIDVRGYGGSSRPTAVEAYRLIELCGDVAAVIEHLSPDAPAILFGHDWGAPIAANTARVHPELVRAVALLSVPYVPASPGDPMEFWEAVYADRFFYMKYFQAPGVPEAAFEADLAAALRKVYYAISGDAPSELWTQAQPDGAAMLDFLVEPDPAPAWMSADRIGAAVEANAGRSTHGWFNRYRAQHLDGDDLAAIGDPVLTQPACFIGGELDVVRRFVPGVDVYADPGQAFADHRATTIVEGAGHWVHQERPDEVDAALAAFLASL